MKTHISCLTAKILPYTLLLFTTLLSTAFAAQVNICDDIGDNFSFGSSVFSSAGNWVVDTHQNHGVAWKFNYLYTLPNHTNNPDYYTWFIRPRTETILQSEATPVYTFYQLLKIGQHAGLTGGHEADVVKQVLQRSDLMHKYFTNLIDLLEYTVTVTDRAVIHIEPDSWGFMWWAMGQEGNDDAESITVKVAGSGHPEVSGFADNAAGFAKALLAIRDHYAPHFRMAFHVSNFRTGSRPDVVVNFLSSCGQWDLLITEPPHLEPDPATWWQDWDETKLETNLDWFATISAATNLPFLIWQTPIGNMDFHLLGNDNNKTGLERFAAVNVVGVLFEHQNFNNASTPDNFRADGNFGNIPPESSGAGGTAGTMRQRVAAYSLDPYILPRNSICGPSLEPGDVNGDGSVDLVDLVTSLQIMTADHTDETVSLDADVNQDNTLGLAEAVYLLARTAGLK